MAPINSPDYSATINELRNAIPRYMDKNKIPGLAISIVNGTGIIWTEGFGYTDCKQTQEITPDTLFSLQSISKTYTATGFLIAVQNGLINFDDKLKQFYPEFTVKSRCGDKEADKITFRHLLGHRSGLCHEAPVGQNYDDTPCTFEEHIASISQTWLKFPVEEKYSYSNLGMDLVGYVLQRVSGISFSEYMQQELLEPLKMTGSTFDYRQALSTDKVAKGHTFDDEAPQTEIAITPSGGLFSSVRDMAQFISFQLFKGQINGKQFISKKLLQEMCTPQFDDKGMTTGYYALGLAVNIDPRHNSAIHHHGGGGYGYLTSQIWMPEHNLGIAILTNQSYHDIHALANGILTKILRNKLGTIPSRLESEGIKKKQEDFTGLYSVTKYGNIYYCCVVVTISE